jgi:hypothetical protein
MTGSFDGPKDPARIVPGGSNTADNHLKVAQPVGVGFSINTHTSMLCDELSLPFNNVTLQLLCDEWASVFTLQLLCDEWAAVLKLFLSFQQCSHFNCYAMSGLN